MFYRTWQFDAMVYFEILINRSTECTTHQIIMILCFIVGIGVWEEQHLRVGVDAEVELNWVFVPAQEVGHSLGLWFGLGESATVDLRAGIMRGSLSWNKRDHFKATICNIFIFI